MSKPEQALAELERAVRDLEALVHTALERMDKRIDHAVLEARFVRRRLASYHPEPSHCPHCGARVHPQAKACAACGKDWERKR